MYGYLVHPVCDAMPTVRYLPQRLKPEEQDLRQQRCENPKPRFPSLIWALLWKPLHSAILWRVETIYQARTENCVCVRHTATRNTISASRDTLLSPNCTGFAVFVGVSYIALANLGVRKWWYKILTHWGRVTQICVFTLQLCTTDDANLRF